MSSTFIFQRDWSIASFFASISFTMFSSLFSPWFSFFISSCIWIKETAPAYKRANKIFYFWRSKQDDWFHLIVWSKPLKSISKERGILIAENVYLKRPLLVILSNVPCLVPTRLKMVLSYNVCLFQVPLQLSLCKYNQWYVALLHQKLKWKKKMNQQYCISNNSVIFYLKLRN